MRGITGFFLVVMSSPLVIIHNLDLVRGAFTPDKADTILFVNSNAVLTQTIALERFQSISRRQQKFFQVFGSIEICKFADRDLLKVRRNPAIPARLKQFLGVGILEAGDPCFRSEA